MGVHIDATPARRKGAWIVAGTLLVLGWVAAWWWYEWVPDWRPPLHVGERYGIDVSAHQGAIDWELVARDGIEFAYIKASEGGDFVDDRFAENWAGADDAGLDRGAYHFFTLCTPGADQAQNFLEIAAPDPDALAPAVDLELAGNCSERPPPAEVNENLNAFVDIVEASWGRQLVLYVGHDYLAHYPDLERHARPLWLRRFLVRPSEGFWEIWQVHGYARVEGIDGPVDLDVMRP